MKPEYDEMDSSIGTDQAYFPAERKLPSDCSVLYNMLHQLVIGAVLLLCSLLAYLFLSASFKSSILESLFNLHQHQHWKEQHQLVHQILQLAKSRHRPIGDAIDSWRATIEYGLQPSSCSNFKPNSPV